MQQLYSRPTHLVVMVLAEAHLVLEQRQQGEVVLQGLGEGHRHPRLPRVAVDVDPAQVEVVPQALDEVVLGQTHPLVCPHAVVAQVLLAVEAVGGGRVLLVAGAALGLSQVAGVQEASVRVVEARGAPTQASPQVVLLVVVVVLLLLLVVVVEEMVAILVVNLLLRAHHHVQQVAEEEVGGRQGVHAGLGDAHLLVAGGAPQLQRVPGAPLALQALPAEGVQAGQDVQPAGGLAGGGRGVRGRRRGRRAGGDGRRGAAQLLAERAGLQVRVRERSHLWRRRKHGLGLQSRAAMTLRCLFGDASGRRDASKIKLRLR